MSEKKKVDEKKVRPIDDEEAAKIAGGPGCPPITISHPPSSGG